ncbi:MAG: hypothetical protein LCH38_06710 [Proteobacteria bacterium]|nr:hypothetical protein [Pseudomonadota bacterium]
MKNHRFDALPLHSATLSAPKGRQGVSSIPAALLRWLTRSRRANARVTAAVDILPDQILADIGVERTLTPHGARYRTRRL